MVISPVSGQLEESVKSIETIYLTKKSLPTTESGDKAMAAITDPWGNPLRYKRLNSRTARISSDGPDQVPSTQWDLSVTIEVPEEDTPKERSWTDSLRPEKPWLERRKTEMGYNEETKKQDDGGVLMTTYAAGGGTKLEGAAYFWFFTKLMLATAVIFIPYAVFYREKTYLQD
jgi:POT family proton-dependent oligopeptide transporter